MINFISNVSKCLILFFIHSFWKTGWPDPNKFVPFYPWGIRKTDLQCAADFYSSHLCYRRNRLQWCSFFLCYLYVCIVYLLYNCNSNDNDWLFWIKFLIYYYCLFNHWRQTFNWLSNFGNIYYCYYQFIIISQSGLQCYLQVLGIFVLICSCCRSWDRSWPSLFIPQNLAAYHRKCFLILVLSIDNYISFCGLLERVVNQRY